MEGRSPFPSDENMFPEVPFVDSARSTSREWLKKQESNALTSNDFKAYWKQHVPEVYSLQTECDCLNITYDKNLAREVLFLPLERFIIGKANESDPQTALRSLKTQEKPPALCGRVFKKGEPTYCCRDCGLDPTCVLCIECFRNSEHKNHRYKMSTSGGGGYCDCGDKEAWKEHPFCANHQPKSKSAEDEEFNPVNILPNNMIRRIKVVFETVLPYCIQILTWENPLTLPEDLQVADQDKHDPPNTYVTMMFNDEVHTYDQVIQSLIRAIHCTQKEAMDYATIVDREGRSTIKCAMFTTCENIERSIVRLTSRNSVKPLKVSVMHTCIIAHQTFAMQILQWLQEILGHSEAFRRLFSDIILDCDPEEVKEARYCSSMLEKVMSRDSQLWKAARMQWHQLFISGMLMDQHCKRAFSKVFTQNYPVLMKDFIADDHEHTLSITSLSVQIFTVPTVAHMLILENNAIASLLNTFILECDQKRNKETGKLAFEKHTSIISFRRAQYVLYDIKYLLLAKPEEWTLCFKRNFLQGLSTLLSLMSWMQGMDAVVRQVGQHMEFEPEWESGFNLHIRLASVIELMLQWCGSDRTVLQKSFRACLKCLQSLYPTLPTTTKVLNGYTANCITYDVESQAVSIHLPVSRFVAGLHLHFHKYNLKFSSEEFNIEFKQTPEELMEFPLRTIVMIAQVRAGMWRRNGYSLLNQIFFYHNVRCRSEMFDKDIAMIQTAACLIEPNQFLIHILNKFNLLKWVNENYKLANVNIEDGWFRFTITLVDEMLSLLIIIISERHVIGVGQVTESDVVKKEIIQQLCVEPMAHSDLSRELPQDNNNETGLEDVVLEVADFKKPQESGKGKYELKTEYYEQFNPFYYHYSKEDQSKAEERQRKRRKQASDEECCPPPVPPELTEHCLALVHVLDCDIMLHIIKIVLFRVNANKFQSFSESHFHKVLHLIGLALHEEVLHLNQHRTGFQFIDKAQERGLLSQLESLVNNQVIEAHKDLLTWTIKKFQSAQNMKFSSSGAESSSAPPEDVSMKEEWRVSDPKKEKKSKLAAERRAKIMAQMSAMQKKFIKCHAELFAESEESSESDSVIDQKITLDSDSSVALALSSQMKVLPVDRVTCILCQESQDIAISNQAMVLAAFVQKSTVMSQSRHKVIKDPESHDPLLMSADLFSAPHTKTCGHAMHAECYQKVFDSVLAKERQPPSRYRHNTSFDINKHEFLCPLCESITNTAIPLLPPFSSLVSEAVSCSSQVTVISFDEWLSALLIALQNKITVTIDRDDGKQTVLLKCPKLSSLSDRLPVLVAPMLDQLYSLYKLSNYPELSTNFKAMMTSYSQATYTIGLGVNPQMEDIRTSLMVWQSCAYTILSLEWLIRDQQKPLFGSSSSRQVDCLKAVIRFASAYNLVVPMEVTQNHCTRLLSWLLAQDDSYNGESKSILDVDMFTLLVSLSSCACTLFQQPGLVPIPIGNVLDLYVLRLVYIAHVIQILVTSSFEAAGSESAMDVDSSSSKAFVEEQKALNWYHFVRKAAGVASDIANAPSGCEVLRVIRQSTLPFLRCAAIFYHYMTEVPPLPELCEVGCDNEHEMLCHYLGLSPDLSQLTRSVKLQMVIQRWVRHETVKTVLSGASSVSVVQYPLKVTQLVDLPSDYSELINEVSLFTCPNSDGDDSRIPAMCLVCGQVLCSQSYCCQTELKNDLVGACCYHAHTCGVGNSLFLRIRDCKLLLRSGLVKGCFVSPPYLDQYGEPDPGLKRGNPLHMSKERYKELHSMWLSHNIPEAVSRALEASSNILPIEWQNL